MKKTSKEKKRRKTTTGRQRVFHVVDVEVLQAENARLQDENVTLAKAVNRLSAEERLYKNHSEILDDLIRKDSRIKELQLRVNDAERKAAHYARHFSAVSKELTTLSIGVSDLSGILGGMGTWIGEAANGKYLGEGDTAPVGKGFSSPGD